MKNPKGHKAAGASVPKPSVDFFNEVCGLIGWVCRGKSLLLPHLRLYLSTFHQSTIMAGKNFGFEHKSKPLLPKAEFYKRQFRFVVYSSLLLAISLGIGMIGYHLATGMDWVDAFYNASMILTGMGPIDPMPTTGAKLFAGCYALFSGVIFLSTVAVMFAPVIHRFMHRMHIQDDSE